MKFAVISTWPQVKNAEYEIVERIKIAAQRLGHICIVVDNDGRTLDEEPRFITHEDVSFCISLHYLSYKLFSVHTYGAMWNPPQFLHDWDYDSMVAHLLSFDDYLIYGSRVISEHLQRILTFSDKTLQGALPFYPSIAGDIFEPTLGRRKVFYSGINWERLGRTKGRHHDLFLALDKTGYMNFYGPENFLGYKPWADFESFCGSLPFDGLSTIKEINKCGISLVITSDTHRESEAVSSRLYESCAAGAVIISDCNLFTMKEFGDSILIFKYDKDPQLNYERIMEKIKWIEENPEQALAMAKKSQEIYLKKFSLESTLTHLIEHHAQRQAELLAKESAQNLSEGIDIILPVSISQTEATINSVIASINKQSYPKLNLVLSIASSTPAKLDAVTALVKQNLKSEINYQLLSYEKDLEVAEAFRKPITTGELIFHALQNSQNPYFAIFDPNGEWDDNHLIKLKRVFEDNANVQASYSAYIQRHQKAYHMYDLETFNMLKLNFLNKQKLFKFEHDIPAFSILFKRSVMANISHTSVNRLDGYHNYYFASLLLLNALRLGEIGFSGSVSALSYERDIHEGSDKILDSVQQVQDIKDHFRLSQWYQDMQILHGVNIIEPMDYKIELLRFKRTLKNYITQEFGHHHFIINIIKRTYRLFRKV